MAIVISVAGVRQPISTRNIYFSIRLLNDNYKRAVIDTQ